MSKRIKMSTTVNISEGLFFWQCQTIKLLADLLFRHIDDLTVWCRMMRVSKKFNQVGTRLTKVVKQYDNIDITFSNGHSMYMAWYLNGSLMLIQHWITGISGTIKLHGQSTYFHTNGSIWYKQNWINGRRHGIYEDWYSNGVLRCRQEWTNGELM